jgi:hypothetical protein
LPEVVENEGLKYSVVANLEDGRPLPSFIKLAEKELFFRIPDDLSLVNTEYKVKFKLDDGFSMANERLLVLKIKSPQDKVGREGEAFIASLKIVSMTRDQLLTLRVVGAKGSEKLINKLDIDSFNIRVTDKEDDLKYNITVKSFTASTVTLRLGFKNIKDISSTNVSKCEIKPTCRLMMSLRSS